MSKPEEKSISPLESKVSTFQRSLADFLYQMAKGRRRYFFSFFIRYLLNNKAYMSSDYLKNLLSIPIPDSNNTGYCYGHIIMIEVFKNGWSDIAEVLCKTFESEIDILLPVASKCKSKKNLGIDQEAKKDQETLDTESKSISNITDTMLQTTEMLRVTAFAKEFATSLAKNGTGNISIDKLLTDHKVEKNYHMNVVDIFPYLLCLLSEGNVGYKGIMDNWKNYNTASQEGQSENIDDANGEKALNIINKLFSSICLDKNVKNRHEKFICTLSFLKENLNTQSEEIFKCILDAAYSSFVEREDLLFSILKVLKDNYASEFSKFVSDKSNYLKLLESFKKALNTGSTQNFELVNFFLSDILSANCSAQGEEQRKLDLVKGFVSAVYESDLNKSELSSAIEVIKTYCNTNHIAVDFFHGNELFFNIVNIYASKKKFNADIIVDYLSNISGADDKKQALFYLMKRCDVDTVSAVLESIPDLIYSEIGILLFSAGENVHHSKSIIKFIASAVSSNHDSTNEVYSSLLVFLEEKFPIDANSEPYPDDSLKNIISILRYFIFYSGAQISSKEYARLSEKINPLICNALFNSVDKPEELLPKESFAKTAPVEKALVFYHFYCIVNLYNGDNKDLVINVSKNMLTNSNALESIMRLQKENPSLYKSFIPILARAFLDDISNFNEKTISDSSLLPTFLDKVLSGSAKNVSDSHIGITLIMDLMNSIQELPNDINTIEQNSVESYVKHNLGYMNKKLMATFSSRQKSLVAKSTKDEFVHMSPDRLKNASKILFMIMTLEDKEYLEFKKKLKSNNDYSDLLMVCGEFIKNSPIEQIDYVSVRLQRIFDIAREDVDLSDLPILSNKNQLQNNSKIRKSKIHFLELLPKSLVFQIYKGAKKDQPSKNSKDKAFKIKKAIDLLEHLSYEGAPSQGYEFVHSVLFGQLEKAVDLLVLFKKNNIVSGSGSNDYDDPSYLCQKAANIFLKSPLSFFINFCEHANKYSDTQDSISDELYDILQEIKKLIISEKKDVSPEWVLFMFNGGHISIKEIIDSNRRTPSIPYERLMSDLLSTIVYDNEVNIDFQEIFDMEKASPMTLLWQYAARIASDSAHPYNGTALDKALLIWTEAIQKKDANKIKELIGANSKEAHFFLFYYKIFQQIEPIDKQFLVELCDSDLCIRAIAMDMLSDKKLSISMQDLIDNNKIGAIYNILSYVYSSGLDSSEDINKFLERFSQSSDDRLPTFMEFWQISKKVKGRDTYDHDSVEASGKILNIILARGVEHATRGFEKLNLSQRFSFCIEMFGFLKGSFKFLSSILGFSDKKEPKEEQKKDIPEQKKQIHASNESMVLENASDLSKRQEGESETKSLNSDQDSLNSDQDSLSNGLSGAHSLSVVPGKKKEVEK